jgi:hypothetical protein
MLDLVKLFPSILFIKTIINYSIVADLFIKKNSFLGQIQFDLILILRFTYFFFIFKGSNGFLLIFFFKFMSF